MDKIFAIFFLQIFVCFTAWCEVSQSSQTSNHSKNKIEEPRPIDEVAGGLGVEHRKPPKYAVLPTGKTLPKGIFRVEIPTAYTFGNGTGFDSSGKHVDNGFWLSRWMMGIALHYGVSDRISIGIGVPFVVNNQMGLDGNVFAQNSQFFSKYYNQAINESAAYLASIGNCNGAQTADACRNEILNNNLKPPPTIFNEIVLPTGEIATIRSDIPIKDQLRNLVVNAAIPQNGKTGLGDIQIGILWDAVNERTPWLHVPLFFSFGGGLRFPTGKFDIPMAFRQTGGDGTLLLPGGTFDGILRWNLDYGITPGVFLSWQNQIEYSFTKAILNRSSMLHPGTFNTANPAAIQTNMPYLINHGDGVANALTFERRGVRFLGFLQANWGLGNVSNALKPFGLHVQGKYNIPSQNYLNGTPVYLFEDQFYLNNASLHHNYGPPQAYSVVGGLKISGLPYMVPVEFLAEYEYMFYGVNMFIAPMNILMTLALYF